MKPQSAQIMSQKKRAIKDKSNEMKVFRQRNLPTQGLDENYERQGSVSPLKYRPRVNWEGFTDLRPSARKEDRSDRKRLRTPDPTRSSNRTPQRSLSPDMGAPGQRSNSRKSILKSTRSASNIECMSPQMQTPQYQQPGPSFVLPG